MRMTAVSVNQYHHCPGYRETDLVQKGVQQSELRTVRLSVFTTQQNLNPYSEITNTMVALIFVALIFVAFYVSLFCFFNIHKLADTLLIRTAGYMQRKNTEIIKMLQLRQVLQSENCDQQYKIIS